ncbi:MAG: Cof-like protein hydrolase [Candidatus Woesebacteria bacterium GW2011_GWC2_45_9]|uniref:Cof-like protein hydrolase n=1 Tax=Candidatus Woesebacteria bacterium GW2011_GWC2_45_9 TaxID=1618589 RepID=A0A0G1QED3_9BACT|nr:MAG: Cof-like protein hydrolase [Candidatus Woesebacteria bacterium GW2011_GWC2_45_9]
MKIDSLVTPKGILLDVDGTLTNKQRVVSPRTKEVITKIAGKGIKVGVATGRSYASLASYILPFFPKRSLHLVAGGGQIVRADGKIIWEKAIPHAQVVDICQEAEALGAAYAFGQGPILYRSDKALANAAKHPWGITAKSTRGLADWSTPLVSITNLNEKVRHFLSQQKALSVKEITTGSSVGVWAKKQGLLLKETLAVGDSLNDLELMKMVGLSVAMGQSPEKVKLAADITIGDTDENGLAEFLEKLFI